MTSSFEHLHTQAINTLNVSVEAYRHIETGALHYHFDTDNSENVFLVALRTLPTDSTGVAHILEHTALCGSERFPVRDPFFMMIRRSLNTFMNAFTSSDWTAYPFATQNKKDFDHLLQVYLDAVFFARLDPLDFAQEGHRMEFSEPNNPASGLEFKGVVFNEMKGAMSSITSTLWQALSKHLHVGTTYQHNSGGEPEDIPNLTHDELVAFYKKHYHPSNAVFMTFGDIPASEHQAKFNELALKRFTRQTDTLRAERQVRFTEAQIAEERYAYQADATDKDDSAENKHYFLLSWMLGDSVKLQDVLEAQLMSGVLLDNSSSPLQKFLETTPLGASPSSLCGVDTSSKEIVFCCGLDGAKAQDAAAFEEQVLALLQDIVDNGVDQSLVESVLHQLELSQREVTGNSYPYGLSLMLAALPAALHDGSPIELLDIDSVLNDIRTRIADPDYIPSLIQTWLLNNTHRVRLLVAPDSDLDTQKAHSETERLNTTAQALTEEGAQDIIDLAEQLTQRQEQEDDPDILPKLSLSDIPDVTSTSEFETLNDTTRFYPKATNGLIYQDTRFKLPALSLDELSLLPLMTSCLTELGVGEHDYLSIQQQQSAFTGGLSAFSHIRRHADGHLAAYWGLSTKALMNNRVDAQALLQDTAHKVRFDEQQRIRELIQQIRAGVERSITGNGHGFAMGAAASHHNPLAAHQAIQTGLMSVQRIKQLDDALSDPAQLDTLCQRMNDLYQKITGTPDNVLLIAEAAHTETLTEYAKAQASSSTASNNDHFEFDALDDGSQPAKHQMWLTQTQVNFCAKAFPSVHASHPDAPGLTVLSHFLRNGVLHKTIREQGGAYGGGASQDNQLGVFKFYSYRDPRMLETLADFDASIDWMLTHDHSQATLEEAIFTVISAIDKPSSPSGEARKHHGQLLFGTSDEQQRAFRKGVLTITIEELKRLTEVYLKNALSLASTAVISSEAYLAEQSFNCETQGYQVHQV